MQIMGKTGIALPFRMVPIGQTDSGEVLEVRLRAPRLDALERSGEECKFTEPRPTPPSKGVARNARGEAIKDDQGRAVVQLDESDPGYLERLEAWTTRKKAAGRAETLAMILECAEGAISPKAQREDFDSPLDYYGAVWNELEAFGVTIGGVKDLADACTELAGLGVKGVAGALREPAVGG